MSTEQLIIPSDYPFWLFEQDTSPQIIANAGAALTRLADPEAGLSEEQYGVAASAVTRIVTNAIGIPKQRVDSDERSDESEVLPLPADAEPGPTASVEVDAHDIHEESEESDFELPERTTTYQTSSIPAIRVTNTTDAKERFTRFFKRRDVQVGALLGVMGAVVLMTGDFHGAAEPVPTHIADCSTPVASANVSLSGSVAWSIKTADGKMAIVRPTVNGTSRLPAITLAGDVDFVACEAKMGHEPVAFRQGKAVVDLSGVVLKPVYHNPSYSTDVFAIQQNGQLSAKAVRVFNRTIGNKSNLLGLQRRMEFVDGMNALSDSHCAPDIYDAATSSLLNRLQDQLADKHTGTSVDTTGTFPPLVVGAKDMPKIAWGPGNAQIRDVTARCSEVRS